LSSIPVGRIYRVAGPIVEFKFEESEKSLMMNELLRVGESRLIGELIGLTEENATVQVFEDTVGLRHGEPVFGSGELFSVELGPGLLSSVFDGLQRSMILLMEKTGDYIRPADVSPSIPRDTRWIYEPNIDEMDAVGPGDTLGWVQERWLRHKIMVPPNLRGTVVEIAEEDDYSLEDRICVLRTESGLIHLSLSHRWPVKTPRPYRYRTFPDEPLITGQRVLDTFFPLVKGGVTAITGGFGTGKTVLIQQLAKFVEADVLVYIGCGERGNEIADLLGDLAELEDPKTGTCLMERSILIVNTSDMPVVARESSIYTGITLAEYYRDMGLHVVVVVDSTSRWAEAMREISAMREEIPGEEGYPPYLPSQLSRFYERAGKVFPLGSGSPPGSISIIGAVSPVGGDFSEPVTQKTLQVVRAFWALNPNLAYRRHFPAISMEDSFSFYNENVEPFWHQRFGAAWSTCRDEALSLLAEKNNLERIASLVGIESLSASERITIEDGRLLEQSFLRQWAYSDVDVFCSPEKQFLILDTILSLHRESEAALGKGIVSTPLLEMPVREEISNLKELSDDAVIRIYGELKIRITAQITRLLRTYVTG
jgi:V/A-type H+-transporting ATPase subunit A